MSNDLAPLYPDHLSADERAAAHAELAELHVRARRERLEAGPTLARIRKIEERLASRHPPLEVHIENLQRLLRGEVTPEDIAREHLDACKGEP